MLDKNIPDEDKYDIIPSQKKFTGVREVPELEPDDTSANYSIVSKDEVNDALRDSIAASEKASTGFVGRLKSAAKAVKDVVVTVAASSPLVTAALCVAALASAPFTGPVGIAAAVGLAGALASVAIDTVRLRRTEKIEQTHTLLSANLRCRNESKQITEQHPELQDFDKRIDSLSATHLREDTNKRQEPYKEQTRFQKNIATAKYVVAKYVLPIIQLVASAFATSGVSILINVIRGVVSGVGAVASAGFDGKVWRDTEPLLDIMKERSHDMKQHVAEYKDIHELASNTRQEYIKKEALKALVSQEGFKDMTPKDKEKAFARRVRELETQVGKDLIERPSIFSKIKKFALDMLRSQDPFGKNAEIDRIEIATKVVPYVSTLGDAVSKQAQPSAEVHQSKSVELSNSTTESVDQMKANFVKKSKGPGVDKAQQLVSNAQRAQRGR